MANLKDIWSGGGDVDAAGARLGGEKRPLRDFQPPDYDPRQRRRTDDAFAQQQVHSRRVGAGGERHFLQSSAAGWPSLPDAAPLR